ncbi:MAG: tRNA (adenosine(37)-N6)-dimethylallyltransferase MiaA [Patescibacteria group bacterium]
MKYHITTYGCGMNLADSERIAQRLEKMGHKKTSDIKKAGLIVLNACSVRKSAMDRIYAKVNEYRNKKIIVTGCLVEKDRKKLAGKVNEIWHPDEYFDLHPIYSNKFSASVPIMTGCNNFCTYCAVPFTRGREKSRPVKDIVKEIRDIIKKDYKEVWLLGQNVNSYKSGKTNFPKLLQQIDAIPGKFWIRFTSPHPKDFSNELIRVMAKSEKITNYTNLPVQSGDNEILKRMNRKYTREHFVKLANKIRKQVPDIALSTDTIVGFPGETKKQFKNTIDLYKKLRFDMAFIAQYSPRPGTASFLTMKDDVSYAKKKKRWQELTNILKKTALENNKKLVGQTLEILIDEKKRDRFLGRTEGNKVVEIKLPKTGSPTVGEFVKAKIIRATSWKLIGELAKPKIIVVLGPTASGKSDLAVDIAKVFPAEIISADSVQIYKEMNIGSGKITKKEMRGIKHHLLDVVNPNKTFTVMDFKKQAEKAIGEILEKEKIPIVCGGSGFYIHTLFNGENIPEIPPDWPLRKKMEKKTPEELFKILKKLDSGRAKNIDSKNKRRLIRAIEIKSSEVRLPTEVGLPKIKNYNVLYIGIKASMDKLKKRIDKRVDRMTNNGRLEKEVKKLAKKYGRTTTLKNTIGYQEWFTPLGGENENPAELIKLHSLQYAKRQMTWFKKYAPKTHWVKNSTEALKLVKLWNSVS